MPQRVNAVEPFLRAVLKVITCDGTQLLEDNSIFWNEQAAVINAILNPGNAEKEVIFIIGFIYVNVGIRLSCVCLKVLEMAAFPTIFWKNGI